MRPKIPESSLSDLGWNPYESSGLTFAYFKGRVETVDGLSAVVPAGTIQLQEGLNYIQLDWSSQTVFNSGSEFVPGALKLWLVNVAAGAVTGVNDYRTRFRQSTASGVQSVALETPLTFEVTSGPVTTTGFLGFDWATQNQGLVLASPALSADKPSFRALASTDIPDLPATKITSGTFSTGDFDTDLTIQTNVVLGAGGGTNNLRFGQGALGANTTGYENVAIGGSTLYDTTEGHNNTALGVAALRDNQTGSNNVAVGSGALMTNTEQDDLTAVGTDALRNNTAGVGNTAVGAAASSNNTIGSYNTSVGAYNLSTNIGGSFNTAVGYGALLTNDGYNANTSIGTFSMLHNASGYGNTAVGYQALTYTTAGGNNTSYSNCAGLGNGAAVSGSNQVQLGNSSTTVYAYGAVQNRSDARDKTDIRDTQLGLSFINALRPVDFRWDLRDDYVEVVSAAAVGDDGKARPEVVAVEKDGSRKRGRFHHGLIAQQVQDVLQQQGIDFGGFQDHKIKDGEDVMSIGYTELIAPLIKAVQELSARVAELESKSQV